MSRFVLSDTREPNSLLKQRLASEINEHGNSIAYVSSSPQDGERMFFHIAQAEYAWVSRGVALEYFDLSDAFSDDRLGKMLNHGVIHLIELLGNSIAMEP